jgi:phosphatidylglycerophosphate synthase
MAVAGLLGLFAIILLGFSGVTPQALLASTIVYAFGVAAAARLMRHTYPHDRLGLCNVVTMSRMVLMAALVAPLASAKGDPWLVFPLALVAFSLDGIDGWLARRERLVSEFGARFDMEVDSALALVLALLALASGNAGPLVLMLGLPRYIFVAASVVLPWLDRPLPDRYSRKVFSVVQLATLIMLQLPTLPDRPMHLLVALATAGLVWSFGRDIAWLWRKRS